MRVISMARGTPVPGDGRKFSDIPYAGLFGDTVIARVVEEIIADPHSTYRPRELEELTEASAPSVRDALLTLTNLGLLVSSGGKHPVYSVDKTRKTFVALTLLAYASLDDREGSDCMHTALQHYCETLRGNTTIARIQSEGYDALVRALGPEDAARFIRSYGPGSGPSLKERKKVLVQRSGSAA